MEELSAVLLLQRIMDDALEFSCSDVHIYTDSEKAVVKFRTDGVLSTYMQVSGVGADMVRRIKALARMDVAESRLPQDGSFEWESETLHCHVRVSTLPTIHGEAVVMRLFHQRRRPLDFTTLGMSRAQCEEVVQVLDSPSGLVMVCGPTNSGKTTTLYAMMLHLARLGRKVISIEDPVEIPLDECQQVEVRERVGVTFDVGLRALLRHDPDVIMIGEIRDAATAEAAARAALTGHLVLSTTHAPDVVGALMRMTGFGVSRALLGAVIRGVIVQSFPRHAPVRTESAAAVRKPLFSVTKFDARLAEHVASSTPWWQLRQYVVDIHVSGERDVTT